MKISIIIPCFNEEKNLDNFYNNFLKKNLIDNYELIFVDDYSNDDTERIIKKFMTKNHKILYTKNNFLKGLGGSIRTGIFKSSGKFVTIMMSDSSDSIDDLYSYYTQIRDYDYDAIFGSRFIKNSKVNNYPIRKLLLNRIFNYFVKIIFWSDFNDFTNAFKIYKKKSLNKILPLVSESFNIFLEIPLKIISRNLKYKIIPITWHGQRVGESNFKIKELRSKYFFTLIYCFAEKFLILNRNK